MLGCGDGGDLRRCRREAGGSRHVRIVYAVIFENCGCRLARQDIVARRRIGGLSLPVQSFPSA